jgi:hypothetical protein
VVDEAPSNITEAILDMVETTPVVVDTTQNVPEIIPDLIEVISANTEATAITTSMVSDVNALNDGFSRYVVLSQIVVGYPADIGHQLIFLCVVLEAACGVRLQRQVCGHRC